MILFESNVKIKSKDDAVERAIATLRQNLEDTIHQYQAERDKLEAKYKHDIETILGAIEVLQELA